MHQSGNARLRRGASSATLTNAQQEHIVNNAFEYVRAEFKQAAHRHETLVEGWVHGGVAQDNAKALQALHHSEAAFDLALRSFLETPAPTIEQSRLQIAEIEPHVTAELVNRDPGILALLFGVFHRCTSDEAKG